MPDCIVKLLHNLYGDVSIHFDLGKLMEDVQYKHSFLQGAPELPLQYMLTYQPFLDKFESRHEGILGG
ncbi:hypothetical protein [Sporisorium scitamineum]|uniref:Uncharacterized protein n=1 Tax=Sporisorium scitamineum TaxID=49012 RepID=A0A0F7S4W8_9BASI|nr:hypothetical protein [Sporisorium scitamineum]